MAHDRPDVAHIQFPYRQIALPADHVERIKGIEDLGNPVVDLDANFPLPVVVQVRVGLGYSDDAGIVERVMADQSLIGRFEFGARF